MKVIDTRSWFACTTQIPPWQAVSWQASNRMFIGTFIGILATIYLFVLVVDPYGVVPFSLPFERPLMSTQRQMYPQILRTGRYDSIVVGSSTSALLDPAALGRVLGGHFAILAMASETAREQVQIVDYFRRTVAAPKAVLIGLDHEWCYRNGSPALRAETTLRENEFPAWAYDDNRWNDLLHLLNMTTADAAGRIVLGLLGWIPEKLRRDGYETSLRPDSIYDPVRAHDEIWGAGSRHWLSVVLPEPRQADDAAADFETLQWLDGSLARLPADVKKYLLLPPVHIHTLALLSKVREAECKRRVTTIARQHGATLVDWRIASPLSSNDANFWDPIHYRLPVAYRLIDDLGHVVNEGRASPDNSYRIMAR